MTEAFSILTKNIDELKKGLGVDSISKSEIDAEMIESTQIKAKSLIVLGHAFIEQYFEVVAYSIALSGFDGYKSGIVTKPFLIMAMTVHINREKPNSFDDKNTEHEVNQECWPHKALSAYKYCVNNNHGIREKNIFDLFWPLGFSKTDFNEPLLPLLDAFGSKRGMIAHTGNLGTANKLNILDESKALDSLIEQIEIFDNYICEKNLILQKVTFAIAESSLRSSD